MLSYDELCRHPASFPSLTGMRRAEFDALLVRFGRAEADLRARAGPHAATASPADARRVPAAPTPTARPTAC